ncbi:MAG: phenylalanine--tRNA ligase subunit beta [Tissierellia bacterium]|nr:phenylalanine--tRNA ligase subunit beta [Tissierellia bacterium]
MLLPIAWLKKYINTDKSVREIADAITASGSHVESIMERDQGIQGVVVGQIEKIESHPNADRLVVCHVNVGDARQVIVTGATNVFEGAYVPVALDGAVLAGDFHIKTSDFRGVMSHGMLCSLEEMGFPISVIPKEFRDGIYIMEEGEPGQDFAKVLELDQEVIELEITPNRPDCLSILGMALETAASIGTELSRPKMSLKEESPSQIQDLVGGIEIQTDKASRFYGRVLEDIEIKPSPQWMQNDLMAAGVRPINNVVDLTNYVMLEVGQPLHAYDLDKLKDQRIVVKEAGEGEVFTTLDGVERTLSGEDIIIADGKETIGLAGIMGGLDSEVTEGTTRVLFEGAHFMKSQVRKTSKRLGLRTEASARFEKGLDPERAKLAVDRVCQLAEEIGCGKLVKGAIDKYPRPLKPWTIEASVDRINGLLGTEISGKDMEAMLNSLEIKTELTKEGVLVSQIPTNRQDLSLWQDIAEEVARLYNYHNIEPKPLAGELTRGGRGKERNMEGLAKEVLLMAGFSEFMTYSFMSPGAFDRLKLPEDSPLKRVVAIKNPLGEEYSVMRSTLLPNMLDVLQRNISYRIGSVYGYEFGNVFSLEKDEEALPKESLKLALGFYGQEDFYFLKEVITKICDQLGIQDLRFVKERDKALFHRGQCARIEAGGEDLGVFGQLHPKVAKSEDIRQRVFLGELDFSKMVALADLNKTYQPIAKYPTMERDLAVILDKDLEVQAILDLCQEFGGDLLEVVKIFDVYTGDQVEEGKKSVAFSLVFRAPDRTLVEEEVEELTQGIISKLEERFAGQLRK